MSSYEYNLAQPESFRSEYNSDSGNVDFVISFQGKKLVGNSIRLCGNVNFTTLDVTKLYEADKNIGAHQFVSEVNVKTDMSGYIEQNKYNARFVGMLGNATKTINDNLNSQALSELKAPANHIAGDYYKGVRLLDDADPAVELANTPVDFSILLDCCLNYVEGSPLISYSKTGDIRITLRLARDEETLFGEEFDDISYSLSDLRLSYMTVPDDGTVQQNILRKKDSFETSIDGTYITVSTKVPSVCTGVSCSFIRTSKLGQYKQNTNQQEEIPGIKSVQFLFNDTQNRFITYEIRDKNEIVERYLESFAEIAGNVMAPDELDADNGFGIGVNFRSAIDLSQQKFTTIINSNVSNTDPYTMYLYFHGIIVL